MIKYVQKLLIGKTSKLSHLKVCMIPLRDSSPCPVIFERNEESGRGLRMTRGNELCKGEVSDVTTYKGERRVSPLVKLKKEKKYDRI